MALSETISIGGKIATSHFSDISLGWTTVITAGGPAVQDAATITNPNTQITAATRAIFRRNGIGRTMLVRLGYDDGLTGITSPVVKVFGRTGSSDVWTVLETRSDALTMTLTTVTATDVSDGTLLYTQAGYTPTVGTQSCDVLGCEEFLIGVQTALAGATTTTANSVIQVKFI
jgi:hypothetical protein